VILALLPVAKYSELWATLQRPQKLALLLAIASFGTACLLSLWFDRVASWSSARHAAVRSFAVLALFLVAALVVSISLPRYVLLPLVAITALIIPLAVSPIALRLWPLGVVAVATGAFAVLSFARMDVSSESERTTRVSHITTAFYSLQAVTRQGWIPQPETRGGGMQMLDNDRVLLATGDGSLFVVTVPTDPAGFKVEPVATRVPLNREEFAKAFGGSSRSPKRSIDWRETGPPRVQTWRFRVADVLAAIDGDSARIFASHHYWNQREECFLVRVSELKVLLRDLPGNVGQGQWTTLYDSSPCVPLKGPNRKRGKNPFRGEEIGGRMVLMEGGKLLLTLGDHGFSGIESTQIFSQDPEADYGKTILIDLATREHRVFTLGHRNPQGLYRAADGRVWLTEHGAQGGDELNLLRDHTNFGWPNVTYGTEYGHMAWPLSSTQGRHPNYQQPALAWLPSIGVSDVMEINSDLFPIWRGDLLVGSLSTRGLYRVVVDGDHAVLQEPIQFGRRVRDILQMPDGRILIWSDDAALTTLEPSSASDGAGLFASQCSGCHGVVDGMSHRIGPDLFGIVGRSIGRAEGYDEYSPALQAQSGTWNEARLDKFLQDPQAIVPGTSMAFPGVADADQRKAIIEYMKHHTGGQRKSE
jgi:aldose sugar dehydrogenase